MLEYMEWTRKLYENVLGNVHVRQRSLVVAYEALSHGPQMLFDNEIFPFLQIDAAEVSTKFIKMNPYKISEMIENYLEVKDLIENASSRQEYH